MRAQLGWLTFLLASGFAGGLVLSVVGNAWFGISNQSALIGFFGFGIPMMVAGLGTAALWTDEKPLLKTLGWTSTVIGLACGVCLFILVAGWVMGDEKTGQAKPKAPSSTVEKPAPGVAHFFGFGIPMLVCGSFGIAVLLQSEGKSL